MTFFVFGLRSLLFYLLFFNGTCFLEEEIYFDFIFDVLRVLFDLIIYNFEIMKFSLIIILMLLYSNLFKIIKGFLYSKKFFLNYY